MPSCSTDVMKTWFRRVWDEADEKAIYELFPEDGEVKGLGGDQVLRGPDAFKGFWEAIRAAFDVQGIEVLDCIECGDRGYLRCRAKMTFRGKPVTLEGGTLFEVRDGQVLRADDCWDFLGLLTSMEALPQDAFSRACGGARWD